MSEDIAKLAREWAAIVDSKPTEEWIRGYVLDGINYAESLCDALEEKERRVQVWRQNFSNANEYIGRLEAQLEEREREVQRLREEVKNVTSMLVAVGGAGALQAAREREGGLGHRRSFSEAE